MYAIPSRSYKWRLHVEHKPVPGPLSSALSESREFLEKPPPTHRCRWLQTPLYIYLKSSGASSRCSRSCWICFELGWWYHIEQSPPNLPSLGRFCLSLRCSLPSQWCHPFHRSDGISPHCTPCSNHCWVSNSTSGCLGQSSYFSFVYVLNWKIQTCLPLEKKITSLFNLSFKWF